MKGKMSGVERVIRVVIGLAIVGAGYYYKNWLGLIGLIPLITAAIGWCPLTCCGKSSCSSKPEAKDEHKHGSGCCH